MSLFDQISEDIKKAMLAKDKVALDALRGIKKEFLEAKTAKGGDPVNGMRLACFLVGILGVTSYTIRSSATQ